MVAVTGSFTGAGASNSLGVAPGVFNASLWGTWVGSVQLERSFDQGVTWLPLTGLGTAFPFTANMSEPFEERETGVLYRWNCTAFTSGPVNYRLSQ